MITALYAGLALTHLSPGGLDASIKQEGKASFRITFQNRTPNQEFPVCLDGLAYNVEIKSPSGKIIGSVTRYLEGGIAPDGTLYYPPALLVRGSESWMLLPAGGTVSFLIGVYEVGGPVATLPKGSLATVRFRAEYARGSVPDWIAKAAKYGSVFPAIQPIRTK